MSIFFCANNCRPTDSARISGIMRMLIMKALLRTEFRYSAKATRLILSIARLLRLGAGNAHEDVVQGRLGDFKMSHPGFLQQLLEQHLRVAVVTNLLVAPKVPHVLHARHTGQEAQIPVRPDVKNVPTRTPA